MAEKPTTEQLKIERPDIQVYVEGNTANLSLDDYISKALAQVKRDVHDIKGIKWSMVYDLTTNEYFKNTDGDEQNEDRLHNVIILRTVADVFKDYAINRSAEGVWNSMYIAYRADYDLAIEQMKLSVDRDETGTITEDEDNTTTQVFQRR